MCSRADESSLTTHKKSKIKNEKNLKKQQISLCSEKNGPVKCMYCPEDSSLYMTYAA